MDVLVYFDNIYWDILAYYIKKGPPQASIY